MVSPNAPAPTPSYVAILKCKQSELLAIQATSAPNFIPLLEVIDLGKGPAIAKDWPHTGEVVWIQPLNLGGVDDEDWADATEALFDQLRAMGVAAVVTVGIAETPESLAAAGNIVSRDGRGLVLRLDCEEVLDRVPVDLQMAIDDVLGQLGVTPDEVDLVLDAGLVEGGPASQSTLVATALDALPYISDWRNVVVAFSAFPAIVGNRISKSSVGSIPRVDAASYSHLVSSWSKRTLVFGDYAVGVPTYADAPFSPIPNIRYALPGEWIVRRAASKTNPSPQYVALAQALVSSAEYAGPGFSLGDTVISQTASGACGPGNAGSWLKVAMSRHFAVVLDSLATHGVP